MGNKIICIGRECGSGGYRRAKRMVTHMDMQRKKYYEHYTGKPWGSAESYDLLFDTGETPMELVVAEISMCYGKLGEPAQRLS